MDCWVLVPSVGRTLGRISSGGTHESVHRSKSAFQKRKKTFLICSWFVMSWERCTCTNLGPLAPFPLTVNVTLISVITIALVKQM